eukprot:gnl/Hemi2/12986_TR4437_c0_g1_i1.p1 gnl/Hemi2/12986_TR4437_c0_g1~~gnl/Hemi2/12986_TR4437_c0_g1_i1.p1  ORF type:complete len:345 (-),score=71.68 gnl/Hemi2/12986_TR4437_c0_g1_i1:238-1197(-)
MMRPDPRDYKGKAFRPDPRNVGGRSLIVDMHMSHRLKSHGIYHKKDQAIKSRIDNWQTEALPLTTPRWAGDLFTDNFLNVKRTYNAVANITARTDSSAPFTYKYLAQSALSNNKKERVAQQRNEHNMNIKFMADRIEHYANRDHYQSEPFGVRHPRKRVLLRAQDFAVPQLFNRPDPPGSRLTSSKAGLLRPGSAPHAIVTSPSLREREEARPSTANPASRTGRRSLAGSSPRPTTRERPRTAGTARTSGIPYPTPTRHKDSYVQFRQDLIAQIITQDLIKGQELNDFLDQAAQDCPLPDKGRIRDVVNNLKGEFFLTF